MHKRKREGGGAETDTWQSGSNWSTEQGTREMGKSGYL